MPTAAHRSANAVVLFLTTGLFVVACDASREGPPQTATGPNPQPSGSTFYMKDAYDRLKEHLAGCSARHGYSLQEGQALGPYQLGVGELQWRDCAYGGIRSIALPQTKYPELYTALIDKDKAMTQAIAARRMTRAQRTRQLEGNIRRIQERERAEILQMRPGAESERNQQLARQSMDSINVAMNSFR
jgi:hypothetical protein